MSDIDKTLQIYLVTNISKQCLKEVLFQLSREVSETKILNKHKHILRIVMFMSFKLEKVETRYYITKREALTMIRCLTEVKWFVMGH